MKNHKQGIKPGTYMLEIIISYIGNEKRVMCIPLSYHNETMFILQSDGKSCWMEQSCSLNNFDSVSDGVVFDEIKKFYPQLSAVEKSANYRLVPLALNNGQRYNSIYRPAFTDYSVDGYIIPYADDKPSYIFYQDLAIENYQEYSSLLSQLELMLDELNDIFKVIAPKRANKKVYGTAIRNVIIQCCTEIDMIMKHILERNNIPPKEKYYKTSDYFRLKDVLRLNQYQLCFQRLYSSSCFSPFWRWDGNASTQSIWWYDAYNGIKHDRELNFKQANLGNAINAVMAFAVLLIAQYGYRNDLWNEHVGKIIRVVKEPQWDLKDFYMTNSHGSVFVNYPFK